MASLSRGISFRRQGSSGMSWTDTWSFNEEGVLVRTLKDQDHQLQQQQHQRFAGSSLSRIHDSQDDHHINHDTADVADIDAHETQLITHKPTSSFHTCPPPSLSTSSSLSRSKSVGSSHVVRLPHKPPPRVFKWIKNALHKMKK